jgi:hypothetical protein
MLNINVKKPGTIVGPRRVGVGLGVGVARRVGDGDGVGVTRRVGVGVGFNVGVGIIVAVGVGVNEGVGEGVVAPFTIPTIKTIIPTAITSENTSIK